MPTMQLLTLGHLIITSRWHLARPHLDAAHAISVLIACSLLLLLAPLFALIAVAICLDTIGPVFFKQQRIGQNGVPFTLIKFRSMHTGTHDPDNPLPAVTRVGHVLRRFSLDELPQLINIIKGEMVLVGPRPILAEEVEHYDVWQAQRLQVRPGLTGWAQVNGRNALTWYERIGHDVWYVENKSWWLDLYILAVTPQAVLSSFGLYGPGNFNPGADAFTIVRAQHEQNSTTPSFKFPTDEAHNPNDSATLTRTRIERLSLARDGGHNPKWERRRRDTPSRMHV